MAASYLRTTIFAMLLMPALAASQRAPDLQQGARIRIFPSNGDSKVGKLYSLSRDSITIQTESFSAVPTSSALREISRIDVSRGVSHAKGGARGAVLGLAGGILGGGILGALLYSGDGHTCSNTNQICLLPDCFPICSRSASAGMGAVLGAIGGFVVGTMAGASGGMEEWTSLTPSQIRRSATSKPIAAPTPPTDSAATFQSDKS